MDIDGIGYKVTVRKNDDTITYEGLYVDTPEQALEFVLNEVKRDPVGKYELVFEPVDLV